MGCSSSLNNDKILVPGAMKMNFKREEYLKKLTYFEKIHKKFKEDVVNKAMMDDLDLLEKNKIDHLAKAINKVWDKNKNALHKASIHREIFGNLIYEILGENYIKNEFCYKETDIFKIIKQKLKDNFQNLNAVLSRSAMDILINKEGYYLRNQKSINYYTDLLQEEIQPFWKAINNNLLYNKDYTVNVLNLFLTPSLFSKDDIMEDLINFIEFNENLITINIVICPYKKDGKHLENYSLNANSYKHLYYIFKAVRNNTNIKVLFFHCSKSYQIIIPPEINNLILDKIKEDTILGLHFGKFNFSDDFCSKLFDILVLSNNLAYFGFDSNITNDNLLENLKTSLCKNKSLSAILLSGIEHTDEMKLMDDLKVAVTQNKNVKFFHYEKNLNLI